jgi:hypothetical protein
LNLIFVDVKRGYVRKIKTQNLKRLYHTSLFKINGVPSQQIYLFLKITTLKHQVLFSYLMMLSLSRQENVGDGMINECTAVDEARIRRRNQSTR